MKNRVLFLLAIFLMAVGCGKEQAQEPMQEPTAEISKVVETHIETATDEQKFESLENTFAAIDEYCKNNIPNEEEATVEDLHKTVDFLKEMSNGDVALGGAYIDKDSIEYDEDLMQISFKDAGGQLCFIEFINQDSLVGDTVKASGKDDFDYLAGLDLWDYYKTDVDISYHPTKVDLYASTNITDNRVLILAGLENKEPTFAERVQKSCWRMEKLVDVLKDEGINCNIDIVPATYENLKNIDASKYEMVAILTHGSLRKINGKKTPFISFLQGAKTDSLYEDYKKQYKDPNKKELINAFYNTKDNTTYYALSPAFFEYYYGDDGFEDTIVHLGSCYSIGAEEVNKENADAITQTFLNCGASCVLGNYGSVNTSYNNARLQVELEMLYCGYSFEEAFNTGSELLGDSDYKFPSKDKWDYYVSGGYSKHFYDEYTDPYNVRFKSKSEEVYIYRLVDTLKYFIVDAIVYDNRFSEKDIKELKDKGTLTVSSDWVENGFPKTVDFVFTFDSIDENGRVVAVLDGDTDYKFKFFLREDGSYEVSGGVNSDTIPRRSVVKTFNIWERADFIFEGIGINDDDYSIRRVNLRDYLQGYTNISSSYIFNDSWNYDEHYIWGKATISNGDIITGLTQFYEY